MSRCIDIEKIVPANCPLLRDDCNFCPECSGIYEGYVICYAETEEE